MPYTISFWEEDTFIRTYDLIIVGAGIVGLSAAYYYKSKYPEKRVLVIEKGFYPQGASTRNAGFACFGSVTEILDDLKMESEEDVQNRIRARYEGLNKLRAVLGDEQISYRQCGGFELFENKEEFKKAANHIERFNHWLEDLTSEKEVYQSCRTNGYSAIKNRLEGAIHTGKMMKTLIEKVIQVGVEIRWNSRVTHIQESQIKINESIALNAQNVLIATNGFTSNLLPELPISPARGYVFVTNELKNNQWKGTFHYDKGYVYFRDIGNRVLLGGARNLDKQEETSSEFNVNPRIKNWLIDFANNVLRLENGWQIDYEWTGIMGFAQSKSPVLKKISEHLYTAVGLGGMGVAIGMQIGSDAVELMED
ncbi:MAG TPA: FAD-dependent oxidoreductase [Balneolales bacterium]|nr:FAD-dependent oxidoreductase [Balneolales bacterium]